MENEEIIEDKIFIVPNEEIEDNSDLFNLEDTLDLSEVLNNE